MAIAFQVTFDCADPAKLGEFWAAVLGYKADDPPEGHDSWESFLTSIGVPEDQWNSAYAISDPDGQGPRVFFQQVPESKTVKNRLHLDLRFGGPPGSTPPEQRRAKIDQEVERLLGLGATTVGPVEEDDGYWVVMQDPEGNEFCVS